MHMSQTTIASSGSASLDRVEERAMLPGSPSAPRVHPVRRAPSTGVQRAEPAALAQPVRERGDAVAPRRLDDHVAPVF